MTSFVVISAVSGSNDATIGSALIDELYEVMSSVTKKRRKGPGVGFAHCPRSSVDRALASEAMCAGSTPVGGTKHQLRRQGFTRNTYEIFELANTQPVTAGPFRPWAARGQNAI